MELHHGNTQNSSVNMALLVIFILIKSSMSQRPPKTYYLFTGLHVIIMPF
jgi:hypothetical protein